MSLVNINTRILILEMVTKVIWVVSEYFFTTFDLIEIHSFNKSVVITNYVHYDHYDLLWGMPPLIRMYNYYIKPFGFLWPCDTRTYFYLTEYNASF